MSQSRAH